MDFTPVLRIHIDVQVFLYSGAVHLVAARARTGRCNIHTLLEELAILQACPVESALFVKLSWSGLSEHPQEL